MTEMSRSYKSWLVEEIKDLQSNYYYYRDHKTEAEKRFARKWPTISEKASRLGLCGLHSSNANILLLARGYIDGLLLGDGGLNSTSNLTARYFQKCIYIEWLQKIQEDFESFGIQCKIGSGNGGYSNSDYYTLWTLSYVEFYEMRNRWYSWFDEDGWEYEKIQKVVPENIELTPECVANWYLGDGSISKHTYANSYQLKLSTQGFTRTDVDCLVNKLRFGLDVNAYNVKRNTILITEWASIAGFLNYIRDCRVSCYDYKFPDCFIGE